MTDRTHESWTAFPPHDDQVLRVLAAVASIILLLLFLASTVNGDNRSLVAYAATSFSGQPVPVTATPGRCNSLPLNAPARSIKNGTHLHAIFFADPGCTMPVSVLGPGEDDGGFVPPGSSQAAFDEPDLSLLGTKGALSYRTIALKR